VKGESRIYTYRIQAIGVGRSDAGVQGVYIDSTD